jgi:hypothetical protein
MSENGKVRPVKIITVMGERRIKENEGGVNSTMRYCKDVGKCHSVPRVQE